MTPPTLAAIEHGSFGGHETFPLRYTWLRKAVQHVEKDGRIFGEDDASAADHATTWYLVFNHIPQPEFTKDELHVTLGCLRQTMLVQEALLSGLADPQSPDARRRLHVLVRRSGHPERAFVARVQPAHEEHAAGLYDQIRAIATSAPDASRREVIAALGLTMADLAAGPVSATAPSST